MMNPSLFLAHILVISQFLPARSTIEVEPTSEVLMGMRIEKVAEDRETGITVVTTGSEFILGKHNSLRCFQRIPFGREVVKIILPKQIIPWQLNNRNDFVCVISHPQIRLTIQGDSLLILKAYDDMKIRFQGLFRPAYQADKEGKWLFIDRYGGFGIYPVGEKKPKPPVFDQIPWILEYPVKKGDEIWISVFPPRPYNWKRAYEDLMAHEGNEEPFTYPSTKLIQSTARFCKVMVVHSWFWPGGDRKPWLIPEFVPKDMQKFIRVRDDIHRNGMKMVPYYSPYYYRGSDFFGEVDRALNEYQMDGLYYDGVSMDFRHSYHFVRKTRQMLGEDRILFRHCTSDPLGSNRIYCPFIDTYCDYIYRGEAGRAGLKLDEFLRWTLSGYNISNAVGYWVYTGSTGKPGYIRQAPTIEHIDAALRNEVRLPRTEIGYEAGLAWKLNDGHIDLFDREYYGKLQLLRQWHELTQ